MHIIKKISQFFILNFVALFIKEVRGEDNLPEHSGYLIASNHTSHIDPFIIASIIYLKHRKIARYIGKKESLNNVVSKFVYSTFDVIPIDRNSKSKKTINYAIKCLKNKEIIGIFPEGTRTFDGKIQRGKTGIARMALRSNVCIVPVAIKGTFDLWPRHRGFPKIKKIVKVNIGKTIDLHNYTKRKISKKILRYTTDLIMQRIEDLYKEM